MIGTWDRRRAVLVAMVVATVADVGFGADADVRRRDMDQCRARLDHLIASSNLSDGKAALAQWQSAARALLGDGSRIAVKSLDGHLFTRGGVEYVLDASIETTPDGKNLVTIIAAYRDLLQAHGVDLIVVPVPSREEVYPDKISAPAELLPVTPSTSYFLRALLDADIEVVDLREAFLDERSKHAELLYPIAEIHWGTYGIQRAASEIAQRLNRYVDKSAHARIGYTDRRTQITRVGDLVRYLSPDEAKAYRPETWDVLEIRNPDGTPYRDVEDSPIIVVGDSFTARFSDRSGHLSAHLAKALGLPVTTLTTKGNAPQALRMLTLRGPDYLAKRHVAVWVLSSVCLGDRYADQWRMPPSRSTPTP